MTELFSFQFGAAEAAPLRSAFSTGTKSLGTIRPDSIRTSRDSAKRRSSAGTKHPHASIAVGTICKGSPPAKDSCRNCAAMTIRYFRHWKIPRTRSASGEFFPLTSTATHCSSSRKLTFSRSPDKRSTSVSPLALNRISIFAGFSTRNNFKFSCSSPSPVVRRAMLFIIGRIFLGLGRLRVTGLSPRAFKT